MFSVTNPTFDLHIFQLLLRIIPGLLFLLAILLPCHARPEYDVLPHARGIETRAGSVAFFETEFRPGFALGDTGVDIFFDDGGADAAGGFDAFAVVVEAVGCNSFGAVFVCGYDLWGEGGGVVEVFVVGPVGAAGDVSVGAHGSKRPESILGYFGHGCDVSTFSCNI